MSQVEQTACGGPQQEAVEALASFLTSQDLRVESLWALRQVAMALETEGVGGAVVIKIPRKNSGSVDVQFTTGQAQITLDF